VVQVAQPAFTAKGVALRLQANSGAEVIADPDRLEQVLTNVLNNAVRHTPAGGTVTLSAGATRKAVVLSVVATGEGIDQAHLPHVFERFYRAHARRDQQGSGVGLTISRAILAQHGGTIDVDSLGVNQGTTVTISIPQSP